MLLQNFIVTKIKQRVHKIHLIAFSLTRIVYFSTFATISVPQIKGIPKTT